MAVKEAVGWEGVEVPVAERLCRNDWEPLGVEEHVADRVSDFQGLRVGVPDRLMVPEKVCEWVRDAPGVRVGVRETVGVAVGVREVLADGVPYRDSVGVAASVTEAVGEGPVRLARRVWVDAEGVPVSVSPLVWVMVQVRVWVREEMVGLGVTLGENDLDALVLSEAVALP